MKTAEVLKGVGRGALWVVSAGAALFATVFLIRGGAWLSDRIWPWIVTGIQITFGVNVLIALPMLMFRAARKTAAWVLFVSSYVYGLGVWVQGFLVTYILWGWIALTIGLVFGVIGVVPMAALACVFNGQWKSLMEIFVLVALYYGTRTGSMWIMIKTSVPGIEAEESDGILEEAYHV